MVGTRFFRKFIVVLLASLVLGAGLALAAPPDTTPPSVPGNISATVADQSSFVVLTWLASNDATGVKNYVLTRSMDQIEWSVVGNAITGTSYTDASTRYGIHYYYRLQSVDQAGNASGYASADVTTPVYTSGSTTNAQLSFTSPDNLVTILVPIGSPLESDSCRVGDVSPLIPTDAKLGLPNQKLVAGPYLLICKTLGGDTVMDFGDAATWQVKINKAKLGGLTDPVAYTAQGGTAVTAVPHSKFDSGSQTVTFDLVGGSTVVVLASTVAGLSPGLLFTIVLLVLIIGGVCYVILRKSKQNSHEEFMRNKYYNL